MGKGEVALIAFCFCIFHISFYVMPYVLYFIIHNNIITYLNTVNNNLCTHEKIDVCCILFIYLITAQVHRRLCVRLRENRDVDGSSFRVERVYQAAHTRLHRSQRLFAKHRTQTRYINYYYTYFISHFWYRGNGMVNSKTFHLFYIFLRVIII